MSDETDIKQAMIAFGVLTEEQMMSAVDSIEHTIETSLPPAQVPVKHEFFPGLYVRTVDMKAGTILTSKIHKTEHPFVVHTGIVRVWSREKGVEEITAPFMGRTLPGTRRVLFIVADCLWSTFHPTDKTTPEEIEADIIQPHKNPLLEAQQ